MKNSLKSVLWIQYDNLRIQGTSPQWSSSVPRPLGGVSGPPKRPRGALKCSGSENGEKKVDLSFPFFWVTSFFPYERMSIVNASWEEVEEEEENNFLV